MAITFLAIPRKIIFYVAALGDWILYPNIKGFPSSDYEMPLSPNIFPHFSSKKIIRAWLKQVGVMPVSFLTDSSDL